MNSDKLLRMAAAMLALWAGLTARAQLLDPEARAFSFQTKFTGVDDGLHELHITLYDADDNPVGTPTIIAATVRNGIVSEQIPIADISVFDEGQRLWAEVSVDADPPLSPRIPLIAVPYSFRVHRVGSVELDDDLVLGGGAASGSLQLYNDQGAAVITLLGAGDPAVDVVGTVRMGGFKLTAAPQSGYVLTSDAEGIGTWQAPSGGQAHWSANGDDIFNNNAGNVGIGISTPVHALHVVSDGARTVQGHATGATGVNFGVFGQSDSTEGHGVKGWATAATGATYGVFGQSESASGIGVCGTSEIGGVYGVATGLSGAAVGVLGESWSPDGVGLSGSANATTGVNYGVFGQSASTQGRGVYGLASSTTGLSYGLYGQSTSSGGAGVLGSAPAYGVLGNATATSGSAIGGWFESSSSEGVGALAAATSQSGSTYGVWGQSLSDTGVGVMAYASNPSGQTYGLYAQADSPDGRAVHGVATATTGNTHGVYGECRTTIEGAGVYGTATGEFGRADGVKGETASTNGFGVYGLATAIWGGYGVFGWSQSEDFGRGVCGVSTAVSGPSYGVYGESSSTQGVAVFGDATAASGDTVGVYGQAASADGRGVYGLATDATGLTVGVFGESASDDGRGVHGLATAETGGATGVRGESTGDDGRGIFGIASGTSGTTYGVYGAALPSPNAVGVYGIAGQGNVGYGVGVRGATYDHENGYGVLSWGNFAASGSKQFRIDHPLDPANKFLLHYSAEGPEPLLIYRGNIVLNGNGQAWVELPEYFEEINRDFHYQLTAVGGAGPNLHVAQEIDGNRFQIAGGRPGLKVSWTVTGVRNDPFVRTYGAPVEKDKPEFERGKYQHPELYGMPEEMGIGYQPLSDERPTRPNIRPPRASGRQPAEMPSPLPDDGGHDVPLIDHNEESSNE